MRFWIVLAFSLLIAPAVAQDGETLFKRCQPCHAIGPEAGIKVGPPLNGIVDAPVAQVSEFSYSQVMLDAAEAGMVWDRQTLTRFLKRPKHAFPGTKMTFAGMIHREEVDAIIDYLASFGPDGEPQ